jgi:hypothetical protein
MKATALFLFGFSIPIILLYLWAFFSRKLSSLSAYMKLLSKIFKKHFKFKPLRPRGFYYILAYWDLMSAKPIVQGYKYLIKFRRFETTLIEDAAAGNKLDFYVILWVGLFILVLQFGKLGPIPNEMLFGLGCYRLLDILFQRLPSIFVDPYLLLGRLIDVSRSFIFAAINYVEIVVIFAVYYGLLPRGTFCHEMSPLRSLYFSFITITTVGYGYIKPVSSDPLVTWMILGKIALGIIFVIVVLGSLISGLSASYNKKRFCNCSGGTVFLGAEKLHSFFKKSLDLCKCRTLF